MDRRLARVDRVKARARQEVAVKPIRMDGPIAVRRVDSKGIAAMAKVVLHDAEASKIQMIRMGAAEKAAGAAADAVEEASDDAPRQDK